MPTKLLIFDADDTLRRCTVFGRSYPRKDDEWQLLPSVVPRLALVAKVNPSVHLGIASNQSVVAKGECTEMMAWAMLDHLALAIMDGIHKIPDLRSWNPPFYLRLCPHAAKDHCDCRKPKPWMLIDLMRQAKAPPDQTLFVGDAETDQQAAYNAGCRFAWARDYFATPVSLCYNQAAIEPVPVVRATRTEPSPTGETSDEQTP